MREVPAFRMSRWIAGLTVYGLVLLGFAYAAASAERGVALPWIFFFAPASAASYWIPWDGPAVAMLVMFFGVVLQWPLAAVLMWLVPSGRRRLVAVVALLLHYLGGVGLAAMSLTRFQVATIASRPMVLLVCASVGAYGVGQVAIWRGIRRLGAAQS